ncbi:Ig-like domain-containing protein [Haloprofundus salinisoli]|uniref:Ig-like domain-containing protein n=1 Tax=Haloprofundus salinisoli TaxID=2876193 RepID=UPI001CCB7A2A|nr:Ig-like domain-containing protein [Haloprofundus salinisoli]
MNFRDDQRAVTVQVGFILLFGVLILSLSMYQAQVVPADNEQVEFDHNQRVQADLLDARNAILQSAGTGTTQPVSVSLGARYPNRVLFVNPPPASGRLSTTESVADGIVIRNARAIDTETADYWTGEDPRAFETRSLEYTPDYTRYQNPPTTVYENSVLYNRFDNGATLPRSEQTLIDGRRISLVSLDGELSTERTGTEPLDVRPVSASTRTTTVTSDGEPIRISLATRLSQEQWEALLEDEGYVADVSVTEGVLTITLEGDETYSLRMARVGVGSGVAEETRAYVIDIEGDGATVQSGATQRLTVEVRDRFGNPVSGVDVDPEVTSGGGSVSTPEGTTTGSEGRVTVVYEAPENNDDVEVTVGYGDSDQERVRFDLSVVDGSSSGDDGSGSAWQDANENGQKDPDESVDVSDGQFDDETVDLYIEDGSDLRTDTIDFNAKNVYVEPDLTATASGNGETISITAVEDVVVFGASLETTGSNADVRIEAGEDIDAREATISTQNQGDISMTAGGSISASDAELWASNKGEVTLDAGGSITIQSAIVDGDSGVTYTAGGAIDDADTQYPGQSPTKSPNQSG